MPVKHVTSPGRYVLDAHGEVHMKDWAKTPSPLAVVHVDADWLPDARAAIARPLSPERPMRSLARRDWPTPVKVPVAEVEAQEDEAFAEFKAKLRAQRARRARQRKPGTAEPRIDGARLAAAHRTRSVAPRPAKSPPTRRAISAAPCERCGIRGSIGCDHLLAFLGDAQ